MARSTVLGPGGPSMATKIAVDGPGGPVVPEDHLRCDRSSQLCCIYKCQLPISVPA